MSFKLRLTDLRAFEAFSPSMHIKTLALSHSRDRLVETYYCPPSALFQMEQHFTPWRRPHLDIGACWRHAHTTPSRPSRSTIDLTYVNATAPIIL